jgi:hypothetical protein
MGTTYNTQSADIVGVFDSNFNQMFADARPLKASVNRSKKAMDHPIETGSVSTDYTVIQPIEIDMPLIVGGDDYSATYAQVLAAYNSANLLTVTTNVGTFQNMFILQMPHEESADMMDAVPMALKLREAILITATFQALPPSKVSNVKDASVLDLGTQNANNSSLLYNYFNKG